MTFVLHTAMVSNVEGVWCDDSSIQDVCHNYNELSTYDPAHGRSWVQFLLGTPIFSLYHFFFNHQA